MDNPKETDQQNMAERMSRARDLSKKYGGIPNIPEEELSAIDYVRWIPEKGGTVVMTPLEIIEQREDLRRRALKEGEGKSKNPPFYTFEVPLKGVSESFRYIGEGESQILEEKLNKLTKSLNPLKAAEFKLYNLIPESSPLAAFAHDFESFLAEELKASKPSDHSVEFVMDSLTIPAVAVIELAEEYRDLKIENYYTGEDDNGFYPDNIVLNSAEAQALFTDMERLGGILSDVPEIKKLVSKDCNTQIDSDLPRGVSWADQVRKFKMTYFDLYRHFFSLYLKKHLVLNKASLDLKNSKSPEDMLSSIENADFSGELRQKDKELRRQLNAADIEQKRILSGELKNLQDQIKKRKQIQLGMADLFSCGTIVGAYKSGIKDIQDFLVYRSGKGETLSYTFNASWDEELDRDPGRISGDCTQGKPLPFETRIPVYNVKVFLPGNKQVGNIYLLVTQDEDGNGPIWHFDAIQIPARLNWDTEIVKIIQGFSEEAKKKGVIAITTNEDFGISNYDYIQKAVTDYWITKTPGKRTAIKIPENPDTEKYSDFQATNNQLVLWENEDLPGK